MIYNNVFHFTTECGNPIDYPTTNSVLLQNIVVYHKQNYFTKDVMFDNVM